MSFNRGQFVWNTQQKHRCCWCAEVIEKGFPCFVEVGTGLDGKFEEGRCHPECKAAADSLTSEDLIDGWSPGDWARGRADDKIGEPPQFTADYRGKT